MYLHYIEQFIEWIVRNPLSNPKYDTRDTFASAHQSTSKLFTNHTP